jgi:PAS domain S-box-containing protein
VRLIDVSGDAAEHRDLMWQRPDTGPVPALRDAQEVRSLLPYVYEELLQNRVVRTATPDDLPGDAVVDRAAYAAFNVVSSLMLPCHVEGRLSGILFLSSTQTAHAWTDEEVRCCTSLANVFATALARRHAHEALHESQRRLATLLNNLQGMAYRCRNDRSRTMEFVSDGCRALTGYDADELLQNRVRGYEALVHPEDVLPSRRAVEAALARRTAFAIEYRLRTKTGHVRWVLEKGQGVFGPEARLDAIEGFITDISERRAAEEALSRTQAELLQAQKMEAIGRLAGGVAHDFNNLLSVILGYSEDVMEHLGEQDPRRRALAQVVKAADAATSLTRQLLAFSRKQVVEPKLVRVGELVAGTQKMLGRLIGEDVTLQVEGAALAAFVKVDPGQMEQVILNLAVNARDAMPRGGRLTVSVESMAAAQPIEERTGTVPAGRYVVMVVADTGCGMDLETQAHLFEPFFSTKEVGKGTGLGLATVYGIVRQAGGYIGVDSAPGAGTRFRVYLPEADLPAPGDGAAAIQVAAVGLGERLLVVEDDPSLRRLMEEILTDAGYRVMAASDGNAALAFVATVPDAIHLLVTDVVMPEMNGRQLAEHVTALRPEVKTLFISGYTDDILGHHGVLTPGVRLLNKPFTRIQLLQAVRTALESHRTAP